MEEELTLQQLSNKRSSRKEVFGFVGWMASWVLLCAYIFWAWVPDSVLNAIGITLPSRYWALIIPLYILMFTFFTIPFYFAINLMDTAPLDSFDTLTDAAAKEVGISDLLKEEGDIVPIADIPITVVNEILFGSSKENPNFHSNDKSVPFI